MSGRFAILNTENTSKKSQSHGRVQENSKGNVFKQKPNPTSSRSAPPINSTPNSNYTSSSRSPNKFTKQTNRTPDSYSNGKDGFKDGFKDGSKDGSKDGFKDGSKDGPSKNMFTVRSKKTAKKYTEFILQQDLFPLLNVDSDVIHQIESIESYKSKIQKYKDDNIIESNVLPGYIILTKSYQYHPVIKLINPISEYNSYYNPYISQLIMENRRQYREELNDILGDISPYWNIEAQYNEDCQYYNDYAYSDDEDDYVEDW